MAGRKPLIYHCPLCNHLAKRVGTSTYFTCTGCNARLVQKAGILQEIRTYTVRGDIKEVPIKEYMSADEYEALVG